MLQVFCLSVCLSVQSKCTSHLKTEVKKKKKVCVQSACWKTIMVNGRCVKRADCRMWVQRTAPRHHYQTLTDRAGNETYRQTLYKCLPSRLQRKICKLNFRLRIVVVFWVIITRAPHWLSPDQCGLLIQVSHLLSCVHFDTFCQILLNTVL